MTETNQKWYDRVRTQTIARIEETLNTLKTLHATEADAQTREELEEITIGSLSKAVYEGDTVHGSMMSGQIAGMVKEIKPCKEIIETIVAEAQERLKHVEISVGE